MSGAFGQGGSVRRDPLLTSGATNIFVAPDVRRGPTRDLLWKGTLDEFSRPPEPGRPRDFTLVFATRRERQRHVARFRAIYLVGVEPTCSENPCVFIPEAE